MDKKYKQKEGQASTPDVIALWGRSVVDPSPLCPSYSSMICGLSGS